MKTKKVLTDEDIKEAVRVLKNNVYTYEPLFWVDNEAFYKCAVAEQLGFKCTQEELDEAKARNNGFIKQARGVDLYLTKYMSVNY